MYILASYSTPFGKFPHKSFRDLSREAVLGVFKDAQLENGSQIEHIYFGNCGMHVFGQANIRGQHALTEISNEGLINKTTAITNIEGGCATGSLTFNAAFKDIASGQSDLTLAMGVEKTLIPESPEKVFEIFAGGIDRIQPQEWNDHFRSEGERTGVGFKPHPARIVFLDVHAMQARFHMKKFGSTKEDLAFVASKTHKHGSLNPKAQFQFEISSQKVLEDKLVVDPFTRSMCCPLSDGAVSILLCSQRYFESLDSQQKSRAIKVRSSTLTGGGYRKLGEKNVLDFAAEKAWKNSGLNPQNIDFAEVHDASSFCELQNIEKLGFCKPGEGANFSRSGATALGGEKPINLSGGLISKGHPLAATGLGMIDECVLRLRGEANKSPAPKSAEFALIQNAGGLIGLDEALCGIHILQKL